jgi:hypothetical protein
MATRRDKQIDPSASSAPGRIAVDSRGRNVWQWNPDQLDSTTIMLKSLENSDLALEPTRRIRRPETETGNAGRAKSRAAAGDGERTGELKIEQTLSFKLGGGFDPYNSS